MVFRILAGIGLIVVGLHSPLAFAGLLADAISVSGDSISRAFNANTSSCNYGDNVSRNWATGDNHGTSHCTAGSDGTFSHAERLECNKLNDVTVFNHAVSGGKMLTDFAQQTASMRTSLSSAPGPRYALVLMGHNDACTNTLSKTGNSCSGDHDPNNYCRTTTTAFEREFRRGMDELIQIPASRIGVLATVRISELCNFQSKNGCGPTFGLNCSSIWGTAGFLQDVFGAGGVCASLTSNCSSQRRIDMYNTLVAYNEILSRVSAEYEAIPAGGTSAGGAVKASDVHIRYGDGTFYYKLQSSDLSCCDCFHPADQGHAKLAQSVWDGLQCSSTHPCCADTGDPLTDARCDAVDTTSFFSGGFWPENVACSNGIVDPDEQCDDGNRVDGDCCSSICTYELEGVPCPSDGNVCTDDVCNATGTCMHTLNTRACNDGDACTQTDQCAGGVCTGTNPVVCTALDQCHVAGGCDLATGVCSTPALADGAPCDDGDACTAIDACQSGLCTGAEPVMCNALDQCHTAGTCNPLTGACSDPAKPDGAPCDDGDGCTQTDTCQAGACTGENPVLCADLDQCHEPGTCDSGSGTCSYPQKPDGTPCNDGDACTSPDLCQGGHCITTDAVTCTALGQCHAAGVCDPASGVCSNPLEPDGSACDDGNPCTLADECFGGGCEGVSDACGDGMVQSECNEQCDHGVENGVDDCCSETCQLVDSDGDGICDGDDPCTGFELVARSKLLVDRVHTPPGDDSLSFKGELGLPYPFDPPLDPRARGIRFIVTDQSGTVADVHIEGSSFWRLNSAGTRWRYSNRADARPGGITRIVVRAAPRAPGLVKFTLKARNGSFAVGALPLAAVMILDPPAAASGQCGLAAFLGVPPVPSCSVNSSGSRINCR